MRYWDSTSTNGFQKLVFQKKRGMVFKNCASKNVLISYGFKAQCKLYLSASKWALVACVAIILFILLFKSNSNSSENFHICYWENWVHFYFRLGLWTTTPPPTMYLERTANTRPKIVKRSVDVHIKFRGNFVSEI